jgi:hypothetical protein
MWRNYYLSENVNVEEIYSSEIDLAENVNVEELLFIF